MEKISVAVSVQVCRLIPGQPAKVLSNAIERSTDDMELEDSFDKVVELTQTVLTDTRNNLDKDESYEPDEEEE